MKTKIIILLIFAFAIPAQAKVDLVTLPTRDTVQLTIYNSADMTLARESRSLTLKEGENQLQFSWENTLIDPTSLDMLPRQNASAIDIANLTFPANTRNLGLWNIQSEIAGNVPVEITYLTSGLTWRAFYMGTLTENEEKMRLQGYVVVTNNSGEDYENAQTRLIVGQVHMLDEIAALARRQYPYERPGIDLYDDGMQEQQMQLRGRIDELRSELEMIQAAPEAGRMIAFYAQAEIIQEGLSEYFLYTIEGTETIENGWTKRLQSFDVEDVNVINLYKYEQERYGNSVIRFLSFTNDEDHNLGETPIPDGSIRVYRSVEDQHLSYTGQSSFKYIPVNEEIELNLGPTAMVVVEPTLMDYETENYRFDNDGDIDGWDEVSTYEIEIRNTRDLPIKIEIRRNFPTQYWDITTDNIYEKYDAYTVDFALDMQPESKQTITYTLRLYQGSRQEDWERQNR